MKDIIHERKGKSMAKIVKARIVLEDVYGDGHCEKDATPMTAAQEAGMLGAALMDTLKGCRT